MDTQEIQIVEKNYKKCICFGMCVLMIWNDWWSLEIARYSIAQSICNQGDQATNALILIDGKLEVSIRTENTVRHVGEHSPRNIW